jgi:hypothetical protein
MIMAELIADYVNTLMFNPCIWLAGIMFLLMLTVFKLLKNRAAWVLLIIINIAFISMLAGIADVYLLRKKFPPDLVIRKPSLFYEHGFLPYLSCEIAWGTKYRIYTNSFGLIDSSTREVELAPKTDRVMIIGDSFTEGIGVSFDKTFAGIIAEKLKQKNVDLLNAAVVSYSPKLYYLKIKYLLDRGLKFTHLLIFVDVSDIQDELVYANWEPILNKNIEEPLFFRMHLHLLSSSFLYRYFLPCSDLKWVYDTFLDKNMRTPANHNANKKVVAIPQEWRQIENWAKDRPHPFGADEYKVWGETGFNLAKENLDMLLDLCKKNSITVQIGIYPWPYMLKDEQARVKYISNWQKYVESRGIGFINLFPAFEKDAGAATKYYINTDIHWNAQGHALVADYLMKNNELLKRYLIGANSLKDGKNIH